MSTSKEFWIFTLNLVSEGHSAPPKTVVFTSPTCSFFLSNFQKKLAHSLFFERFLSKACVKPGVKNVIFAKLHAVATKFIKNYFHFISTSSKFSKRSQPRSKNVYLNYILPVKCPWRGLVSKGVSLSNNDKITDLKVVML